MGGQAGCDEIFAYGFRNPFRLSVDSQTGLLLVGDVGQNDIEEVDVVVSGGNYGWKLKEGTFFFDPNGADAGFVSKAAPGVPPGLIDPMAQYDHDEGVSVIGGFVYRGKRVGPLRGHYVFGDFIRPPFNPFNVVSDGRLFVLKKKVGNAQMTEFLVINNELKNEMQELQIVPDGMLGRCLLGFGRDTAGELYVVANDTGIPFESTGVVLRITRP